MVFWVLFLFFSGGAGIKPVVVWMCVTLSLAKGDPRGIRGG